MSNGPLPNTWRILFLLCLFLLMPAHHVNVFSYDWFLVKHDGAVHGSSREFDVTFSSFTLVSSFQPDTCILG